MKAHVSPQKKKTVKEFVQLIKEYPIIGAVNMENLPTKQLQNMRAQLRQTVVLKMTKKRFMNLAIDQAKAEKKDIEKLLPYLKGMPALLFTKENPFALYKKLTQNKSTAPAKAGQKAPKDIIVPAGPTSFAPGPIIGELGQVGIKSGIVDGRVAIKEDSTVAKEGDVINAKLAGILQRLGIEPMEIGLDLVAVYEDGNIYTKDILAIDETEYINNIKQLAQQSFNLAVFTAYPTKDTIKFLLQKIFRQAKEVAKASKFMTDSVAEELLSKAEREMLALKDSIKIEVPKKEEPKPEPKEEKKPEEKPKEEKSVEKKEAPKEEPKKEEAKEEKPKEEKKEEPKKEKKEEPKKQEKKPDAPKEKPKKEEKEQPKKLKEVKKEKDIEGKTMAKITKQDMEQAEKNLKEIMKKVVQGK